MGRPRALRPQLRRDSRRMPRHGQVPGSRYPRHLPHRSPRHAEFSFAVGSRDIMPRLSYCVRGIRGWRGPVGCVGPADVRSLYSAPIQDC
jgi:hypothetical protein